jgi:hypothetical protein
MLSAVFTQSSRVLMMMIALLLVLIGANVENVAAESGNNKTLTLDECHELGFDPLQLACETCNTLSSWLPSEQIVLKNCLSCCQVYRDLPRAQPQRYQAAILVHATGQNEHLDNLMNNDKFEEVVKNQKGSRRFQRVEVPMHAVMMVPSHIYWLDYLLDGGRSYDISSLEQFEAKAKETVTLDPSWKTDDIRDMILTLLADK